MIERSHREDEERFYSRRRFSSEEELEKALRRHNTSHNNTYRKVLNFKNPNEVITEYFEKAGWSFYISSKFRQGTLRSKGLDKTFQKYAECLTALGNLFFRGHVTNV